MDNSYIAGFVDGEGSFHVAFQRSPFVKLGWQIVPEFHISQNGPSGEVLKRIQCRLDCGHIKANHARSSSDHTRVLVVRNRKDLLTKIIPFFQRYRLFTEKRHDFALFQQVVEMMGENKHLIYENFVEILNLAYQMNGKGRYRHIKKEQIIAELRSSETIREEPVVKTG